MDKEYHVRKMKALLSQCYSHLVMIEEEPPQADVVQSDVRPPDAGREEGESGRPPDRESLAKVKALVENHLALSNKSGYLLDYRIGWRECCRELIAKLEDLDRGEASG